MICLGLLELWHLIYPRVFTGFGTLVFFTNSYLTKFQVDYLALFCFSSVLIGFDWIWMERLCKNIQLMLLLLKALSLCLPNSYYTLMTFLRMESVILLSMLKIAISIARVIIENYSCATAIIDFWTQIWPIRHFRLGQEETSIMAKTTFIFLSGLKVLLLLMWKWMGLI